MSVKYCLRDLLYRCAMRDTHPRGVTQLGIGATDHAISPLFKKRAVTCARALSQALSQAQPCTASSVARCRLTGPHGSLTHCV
jgi:hypothetical protein